MSNLNFSNNTNNNGVLRTREHVCNISRIIRFSSNEAYPLHYNYYDEHAIHLREQLNFLMIFISNTCQTVCHSNHVRIDYFVICNCHWIGFEVLFITGKTVCFGTCGYYCWTSVALLTFYCSNNLNDFRARVMS